MWDLIVLVPDHCISIFFEDISVNTLDMNTFYREAALSVSMCLSLRYWSTLKRVFSFWKSFVVGGTKQEAIRVVTLRKWWISMDLFGWLCWV